jgi:predicted DNA-binding protein (MmcQ/YjbR family)
MSELGYLHEKKKNGNRHFRKNKRVFNYINLDLQVFFLLVKKSPKKIQAIREAGKSVRTAGSKNRARS